MDKYTLGAEIARKAKDEIDREVEIYKQIDDADKGTDEEQRVLFSVSMLAACEIEKATIRLESERNRCERLDRQAYERAQRMKAADAQ